MIFFLQNCHKGNNTKLGFHKISSFKHIALQLCKMKKPFSPSHFLSLNGVLLQYNAICRIMPPRNLAYNVATVRITPCCNVAIRPENCVLYSPTTWRKKVIISGGKNHTLFQASNSMREINLSPCLDGIIHHLLRTKTDFLCNSKDNALPSSSKAESTISLKRRYE